MRIETLASILRGKNISIETKKSLLVQFLHEAKTSREVHELLGVIGITTTIASSLWFDKQDSKYFNALFEEEE